MNIDLVSLLNLSRFQTLFWCLHCSEFWTIKFCPDLNPFKNELEFLPFGGISPGHQNCRMTDIKYNSRSATKLLKIKKLIKLYYKTQLKSFQSAKFLYILAWMYNTDTNNKTKTCFIRDPAWDSHVIEIAKIFWSYVKYFWILPRLRNT